MDASKLVGAEELAQFLHVSSVRRVHELRKRYPDFPAPLVRLKRTMVWYLPDVERWLKSTEWRRLRPEDQ